MDREARAERDVLDAGAERGDFAGDVAAQDERRLDLGGRQAGADEEIEMIERASPHAQQDLAGGGDGIGKEGWVH